MSLLRGLVQRMAAAGARLDEIERTVASQQRRERHELTPAERVRLSKEKWAREVGLADAHAEMREIVATRWLMWDVAPPADGDAWLTDPNYRDESWMQIYNTPAPELPSEQLRGRRWEDVG